MTTVTFEDHTDEYVASLMDRLGRGIGLAAIELADAYRTELTRTWSWQTPGGPPHSQPGEIPHKYFGHREGGFQLHGRLEVNNPGQTDFLANYIEADPAIGEPRVFVGFGDSHARKGGRGWFPGTNYLITHDPLSGYGERPWIQPVYQETRALMVQIIVNAL